MSGGTYNPKNHILMINGKRITGFAGKIKIKYDDDRVKEENHGDTTTHVINPSEAGTLEFELTHNSQSNSYLNSLNTAMRLVKAPRIGGSFEAPDSDEKTLFSGGVVKTAPEIEHDTTGDAPGTKTWVLHFERISSTHGSGTDLIETSVKGINTLMGIVG